MAVATFQQGVGGYEGTEDTVIFSLQPGANFGTEGHISADQQDFNAVRQGLLKFGNIFGNEPGQIPFGATINSATLNVFVQDDSNASMQMSLYRMLQDWDELDVTWSSFGTIGGVQASEGEASNLPPDAVLFDAETDFDRSVTAGVYDVKKSLEYWAAGADNFGWLIESAATNGWDFRTKESNLADRPVLTVTYDAPAAAGNFQILNTTISEAEGNSGTRIAKIDVARLGNVAAAASINYTVTAGGANPADPGDFVAVPVAQALNFGANDAFATIEVTINGDTSVEGLETVLVTLAGSVVPGRGVATLTIGDDDVLINEVLANVSSSDDETDREYIELIGTPGANLAGYYFVVFESEEEENSGAGSGRADFVIDLAPYTFGTNGILTFVPEGWEYASLADPDSNIVELTALEGAGGTPILEDSSQTYALIYSPTTAITQGTDYDTVGAYEDATATAIGTGVGLVDQLPADAQWIDSVGTVEGGSGDRDRVATPPSLDHPGIHVHHPTSPLAPANTAVAADAITRLHGQTLPNSIGAWFNGDITNGNPAGAPIRYLEDSLGFISVVAPDGAVITPGAPNILRTVHFRLLDQEREVAEATGSVTLRIERTGDVLNESLMVTYSTLDIGSATEDADYSGVEQTLTFMPGEFFKEITIDINESDGLSEGFEEFRVVLSDASGGYLIKNGSPTGAGNPDGEARITIADANVLEATFQDGLNGYDGTSDAFLDSELTLDKLGQESVVRVDQSKGLTAVRPQQGLIKFDDLFGDGPGQVPMGARIFNAFLTVNVTSASSAADVRFFRMLQDWEQVNANWEDPQGNAGNAITDGVTPDGVEASARADAVVARPGRTGEVRIPLNVDTIQSWANDSLENFGWSIISNDPTAWNFSSSESFQIGTFKPKLSIFYTNPTDTDEGTFSFAADGYTVNESGGTATITVNRIGGSDGLATVNWAVSAGTGTLADITGASSGSVAFADGQLSRTFTVAINNDALLERNETLNLTLSGAGLTFGRSATTLTIRDNDFVPASGNLILNEIFINSPGNDPPHEFVELSGLAGMGMGSLYYVAIEGLIGPNVGAFEKVIDLGAYFNGSNGLSLLTPQEPGFAYNVNPNTTQIQDLGTVAAENVSSNNDSTTYMIIYSPSRELSNFAFDFDWNNDGQLELPVGATIVDAVGVRTGGQPDQVYGPTSSILSFTAAEVDAISRKRSDLDRNDGTAWFGGNLFPSGDDYLVYDDRMLGNPPAPQSFSLPVTGAAMTPGEVNTGSAVQSPLVSLTGVTVNANGSVTVSFDGPVSQVLTGDGSIAPASGSGISITDTNGQAIPIVDLRPTVSGIGTNTLTLTFTGSGVVSGFLPAGNYQLSFVGNAIIANGRATDVANNDTQINGFFEFEFAAVPPVFLTGDYNEDGSVDTGDYIVWRNTNGQTGADLAADGDNDMDVDQDDYLLWRANFGKTLGSGSSASTLAAASTSSAEARTEPNSVAPAIVASVATPLSSGLGENDAAPVDAAAARDAVLVAWPQSGATVETDAGKVARPLRALADTSPAADLRLLLANRPRDVRNRELGDAVGQADGSLNENVDDFFTQLGEERSSVEQAVEILACPV